MKQLVGILFFILLILQVGAQSLKSPNGQLQMKFGLLEDGTPTYALMYKGKEVIRPSKLGLQLKGDSLSLLNRFAVTDSQTTTFDETWKPVWGEVKTIRNHYNELAVTLQQKGTSRQMIIRFRLFNDGLGFRYEIPAAKEPDLFCHQRRKNAVCHDRRSYRFLDSGRL